MQLLRTNSENTDFRALVKLLDQDLAERDGAEHSFYAQFNTITSIQHAMVASLNDQAVGCGAFKPFGEKTIEIKRMYVLPSQRGNRIAAEILTALETWARELGYDTAVLETGKKQPEAIRLYERSGYQVIPNYGQYSGVENSVCMQKTLT